MLFVSRPYHLSDQEADRWIRSQAAALGTPDSVARIDITPLRSAAGRAAGDWDWMFEIHCADAEAATRAARDERLRDLVADLRLLGMHPRLALADGTRQLEP